MKSARSLLSSFASLTLLPGIASAHHGQDFFLLEDVAQPAPGQGLILGTFAWEDESGSDAWDLTTGFSYGVLPRTAVSVQAGFADEGDGLHFQSVTPLVHFDLTPRPGMPVRFGITVGWQFARGSGGGAEHHEEEGGDADHHHEEAGGHDHASGIHNHDDDLFTGRVVLEADLTPSTLLVLNVISVLPDGGTAAWGYGAGLRQRLTPEVSLGLEATGDFDRNGRHEWLGAVYWEPVHHLILKLGAGSGLTSEGPDLAVRTGVVWRF